MNVMSLFDGISCGRLALERANIHVAKYYAIDNLEDFIKEHKHCFEWEEMSNDLYAVILYLMKNREDVESGYYYIAEHEE